MAPRPQHDCHRRAQVIIATLKPGDALVALVRTFLDHVGSERLTALSPEYGQGNRLTEVVESVLKRVHGLANELDGTLADLTPITDDGAVRILTLHKSKGREFDSVILLAAQDETYWGKPDDERATFFVGVSRARRSSPIGAPSKRRSRTRGASRRMRVGSCTVSEFERWVGSWTR